MGRRDLVGGLIRLHVLHHASTGPVFGIGIIARLAMHGQGLSPGTLYPILHELETEGLLRSRAEVVGKKRRRVYDITDKGRRTLLDSKARLWELFKEVFDRELSPDTAAHVENTLKSALAAAERGQNPLPRRRKAAKTPARRARQ